MRDNKKVKLKGTLGLEKRTIRLLLIISLFALVIAIFLEYGIQYLIGQSWCARIHISFLVNIMLGVAGSSTISLICLLVPYLNKKGDQEKYILQLVQEVYREYLKIVDQISRSSNQVDVPNNYLKERRLFQNCQQLATAIGKLLDGYGKVDFTSKEVDKIIKTCNEQFDVVIYVVEGFIPYVIPFEYRENPLEVPVTMKRENLNPEKDRAMYTVLWDAVTEIIDFENAKQLFADYISSREAAYSIFTESTISTLKAIRKNKHIFEATSARSRLSVKLLDISTDEELKAYFGLIDDEEISKRINNIFEVLRNLPGDVKGKYRPTIYKIISLVLSQDREGANNILEELDREIMR